MTRPVDLAEMVKAKKSLGQNFLSDRRVVSRILEAVSPSKNDIVFEIGPGTGALTFPLARQAGFLVAIEADATLADPLKKQIDALNVRIICGDALSLDWEAVVDAALADHQALSRPTSEQRTSSEGKECGIEGHELRPAAEPVRVRVVANLPYYISTAILQILLEHHARFSDYTLMLQDEVVDRIASQPGGREYGYLSVLAQYYCEIEKLFEVPPSAFKPAPKVQSAVVRLTTRNQPPVRVENEAEFFRLIRMSFAQRRKTLLNNLKAAGAALMQRDLRVRDSRQLGENSPSGGKAIPSGAIEAALEQSGIEPRRRAETLSINEFASLHAALRNIA